MKQEHLVTIVKGNPTRELIINLGENSELLVRLNRDFENWFNKPDSEIFSFYETAETPILDMVGG